MKREKPMAVKMVNHSNQHTAQKTALVPKSKTKWAYDLMDQKVKRPAK